MSENQNYYTSGFVSHGVCYCDCHKPVHYSAVPPQCYCTCRYRNNWQNSPLPSADIHGSMTVKLLEERIKDLEESYQGLSTELRYLLDNNNKKPHKCPVCDGLGKATLFKDGNCQPCVGKGVLWN